MSGHTVDRAWQPLPASVCTHAFAEPSKCSDLSITLTCVLHTSGPLWCHGQKSHGGHLLQILLFSLQSSKFFTVLSEQKTFTVTCNGVVLKFMQLGFRLTSHPLILTGAS